MDKLNEILQKATLLQANELYLEPNKKPYVSCIEGIKEIDNTPLLGAQISSMIFPLIPQDVKMELPNRSEVEFELPHKLGKFIFLVRKSPLGFNVLIRPVANPSKQPSPVAQNSFGVSRQSNISNISAQQTEIVIETFERDEPELEIPRVEVSSVNDPEFVTRFSDTAAYDPPIRPQETFSSYDEINKHHQEVTGKAEEMNQTQIQIGSSKQQIESLFLRMKEIGASDLHLSSSVVPMIRKDGKMIPFPGIDQPFSQEKVRDLLFSIIPQKNKEEFAERNDTDFSYEMPGVARFRVNIFMDRKGIGAVFRLIPNKIMSPEELGLSKAVTDLCFLPKGLVVVTGPTGSGKSTTLAALVDFINQNRDDHIITIEDPIEFVHENKRCLVNQREVHTHTRSFKDALRAALREDPDIILVGEMRDLETIAIAIETAETGHLVFGTLHTSSAASTVDRIIDQFPSDRQQQIRVMLSESLKAVIAQTLLPKKGGGRVAAFEILIVTHAISNLIREGKTFQIPSAMQTGKALGMVTLNDSLLELVKKGLVEPREAYLKAVDKTGFEILLQKNGIRL